jgi:predicted amidohydrolase
MKIALVSLDIKWENKEENKDRISKLLRTFSERKVDLVIFPETTLTGFTMNPEKLEEELSSSGSIVFFQDCAKKMHSYIAFGMILQNSSAKPTNNLLVISPQGEVIASYKKIHPFSYAGEDKVYSAGEELSKIVINGFTVGLSICYDLRFPELFQGLSKESDLIINIANWPKGRVEHWRCLLQARAIENQVFFVGVNRTGIDGNGLEYEKSSLIFDPRGRTLLPERINEEVDIYNLDLAEVAKYRDEFPVKKDRKLELYKKVL